MNWKKEVEELDKRAAMALEMGGADKVARQHEFGKLTVRERIDAIADKGSFHEIGALAGVAEYDENGVLKKVRPSNFVFGTAEIDGRPVMLAGDDFTVRGGSSEAAIPEKRMQAEGLALELRIPHIRLVDGMAGGGSVKVLETRGHTYIPGGRSWQEVVEHLATAPSVCLALGSVAGMGAARMCASHYSVIVRDTAQMMIAGPALVDWASLGIVSKEELGHARIHTQNGSIDDVVASEAEAFDRARRFLSYLPGSVYELPPVIKSTDSPERREETLLGIVPKNLRKSYNMKTIIELVFDNGSFFEIGADWGRSIITGFARLDGMPVALFASNPNFYGGGWTADSCRKTSRFIELASTFHLPLTYFEDCPGFIIGKDAEETGTIRYGTSALATLVQANVPFCSIIIRKAFGVAGMANQKGAVPHFRYAWPSGDWGSLPIEGGVEVAYKAELEKAADYDAHLAKIKKRLNRIRSPFRTAERFGIEEIIDPRETRPTLCRWVHMARKATPTGKQSFTFRP
ncbi:acyl-CoA carboxylase subunit beta [Thermodesulfobacteriota bacterium]